MLQVLNSYYCASELKFIHIIMLKERQWSTVPARQSQKCKLQTVSAEKSSFKVESEPEKSHKNRKSHSWQSLSWEEEPWRQERAKVLKKVMTALLWHLESRVGHKKLLGISNYSSFSLTLPPKFRGNIIDFIMKPIHFAKVCCKVSWGKASSRHQEI